MEKYIMILVTSFLLLSILGCQESPSLLIDVNEVSPWCILGFDSEERTPQERISMLQNLGLKKYGYNRGKGEFDEMKEEFELAQSNDIEITSIFLWLNAKRDSIGKLSESNEKLLNTLKVVDQKPYVWISFSNNYFDEKEDDESIVLAVEMIKSIKLRTDALGCSLALYNHHGWFGDPSNQLKILETLNDQSISMVYNFHHAQEYVDNFSEIAKKIKPHLSFVNLNGVKKDGPQILPIGQGDHEFRMIKSLKAEGYKGPWGILGHIKTEDVKVVLERNIQGLNSLNDQYKNSTN